MTHFKTIWPDFLIFIYIIYIYIIYTYMHHMHTYVPLKRCMYTSTLINTCVTSTTKNISEDSCTTYTYMHHQEHMSWYMHHKHIHAPHTHTCTTKYHRKIRYAYLTLPLYSMKDQIKMRDFCWITCFYGISVKCAVHFSEMRSSVKCAVHFSEMHNAFQWNAQGISVCISLKCSNSLKCVAHFNEMRSVFWWAFGFPPSIGLSIYERPIIVLIKIICSHSTWNCVYRYLKTWHVPCETLGTCHLFRRTHKTNKGMCNLKKSSSHGVWTL